MTDHPQQDIRALVVDDHLIMRRQMHHMLTALGFRQVDLAADTVEAGSKLAAADYGIVFLDWHMPGPSGISFMQRCREDRKFDATAFVVVSVESENRFISETLKAGAVAYVVKPVTEDSLKNAVAKARAWIAQRRPKPEVGS